MGNGEWRMVNGERGTGLVQLKPWPPIIFLTLPKKSSKFPQLRLFLFVSLAKPIWGFAPIIAFILFFFWFFIESVARLTLLTKISQNKDKNSKVKF